MPSSSIVGLEQNIRCVSACVSNILTDIYFYVTDIPHSTCTISEHNLIKWCQRVHLLDRILSGLRVRAAGLKLFMVSIDNLVCQLCIGCFLSLSNNGTKLSVITDIIVLSYFLTGTQTWLLVCCKSKEEATRTRWYKLRKMERSYPLSGTKETS